MRFLKNVKTGVKIPYSDLLAAQGHDLYECDKDGRLLKAPPGAEVDEPTQVHKTAFLLNPETGVVLPYSDLLAKSGLIPVNDREEAASIMAAKDVAKRPQGIVIVPTAETVASDIRDNVISSEPDEPQDEGEPLGQDEPIGGVDLDSMDVNALRQFHLDRFGSPLDGRLANENTIRERIRVMLLNEDAA